MSVTFLTNHDRDELEEALNSLDGGSGEESIILTLGSNGSITSSKPELNLYELGLGLLERSVILVSSNTLYRISTLISSSSSGIDPHNSFYFTNLQFGAIRSYAVQFYKNGSITVTGFSVTQVPNIPFASDVPDGKIEYLAATQSGGYELVDAPTSSLQVLALVSGDSFTTVKSINLFEVTATMFSTYSLIPITLALATSADMSSISVYNCARVVNMTSSTDIYAIFTNGIDTPIKMDASCNLTYVSSP